MSILGLDLSLTSSGFCVLNSEKKIETKGLIKPAEGVRGIERLVFIEDGIRSVVTAYRPDVVAIEDYAYSAHAAHSHELGELGGVIRMMLFKRNQKYEAVNPSTLKRYVAGKGNAKKNIMLMEIYAKWGIKFHDDNEADAYALARYMFEKNA